MIKQYFSRLNSLVDDKPLFGLLILIAVAASFAALIYSFGKEFGEFVYYVLN